MASPSFDAALARLLDRIESEQLKLHALLVLHRGELRVERYWPGHGRTDAHRLYSVAKSFTALKPVAAPQTTLRLDHPDALGRPIS